MTVDKICSFTALVEAFIVDGSKLSVKGKVSQASLTQNVVPDYYKVVSAHEEVVAPIASILLKNQTLFSPHAFIMNAVAIRTNLNRINRDAAGLSFDTSRFVGKEAGEAIVSRYSPPFLKRKVDLSRCAYDSIEKIVLSEQKEDKGVFIPLDSYIDINMEESGLFAAEPAVVVKLLDTFVNIPLTYLGPRNMFEERISMGRPVGAYGIKDGVLFYPGLQPYWLRSSWLTALVVSQICLSITIARQPELSKKYLSLLDESLIKKSLTHRDERALSEVYPMVLEIMKDLPTELQSPYGLANKHNTEVIEFLANDRKEFSAWLKPYRESGQPNVSLYTTLLAGSPAFKGFVDKNKKTKKAK